MKEDWWQANFPNGRQHITISDSHGYPVQIAYGEVGTGKPLFLLHGLGSWSYNWRASIQPLSQHFRVICFDAKGYGFSEKSLYRREKKGHQIIELERIILALCDEPAVLVAESLGGLVSLALAQTSPNLVGHLVVINVPVFAESLPHWGMSLLSQIPLELIQTIETLRLNYWFAPLVREIMATERRGVMFDPSKLSAEDVYWISYPYTNIPGTLTKVAEELQIAAREIQDLQANQPNLLTTIQQNLHKIQCPTLILWGEQDSWFPAEHGKKLHQYISNSQFKTLANCGHDASFGSSEEVNAEVISFLKNTDFLKNKKLLT